MKLLAPVEGLRATLRGHYKHRRDCLAICAMANAIGRLSGFVWFTGEQFEFFPA